MIACCPSCGRLRVDGKWGYWDVAPHETETCPSCEEVKAENQRLMDRALELRRTARAQR